MLYVICFLLGSIIVLLYSISKCTSNFIYHVDSLIFELRLRNHFDNLHFKEEESGDYND